MAWVGALQLVREIYIKDYRCVDEAKIQLSRLNILVGRNNTGKTSIVEALALALTAPHGYKDLLGINVLEEILRRRGDPRYLVRVGGDYAHVQLKLDSSEVFLYIVNSYEGVSKIGRKDLAEEFNRILYKEVEKIYSDKVGYLKYMSPTSLRIQMPRYPEVGKRAEEELEDIETNKEKYLAIIKEELQRSIKALGISTMGSSVLAGFIAYESRWGVRLGIHTYDMAKPSTVGGTYVRRFDAKELLKWFEENRVDQFAQFVYRLRETIPYLEDYRRGYFVFKEGSGNARKTIPVEAVGDGVKSLIELMLPIHVGAQYIVIEEPEAHMHPGYMQAYVHELARALRSGGSQFFIATHSSEFIDMLLRELRENGLLGELGVIRLYRYDEGIDYETLSGDEAYEEREVVKGDLRGI